MSLAALPPGLVISAPASGTGKTTVMLGLLAALRDRGLVVQPFKNGPDYIDPAFHRAASGRWSYNLDSWAMPGAMLDGLLAQAVGADLILAEGSMGLFDGVAAPGGCGNGATADLAVRMGWPVVVVIDASGQAQTAAAVALGLARFRPGVQVAGVILNRIASPRHEALVRKGMEEAGLTVLGVLPKRAAIAMPERHLGLVQAEEQPALQALITEAAALMREGVDLDALIAAAATTTQAAPAARITPPGQRIALARDAAFSFVYPHLLHGWRAAGAEVLPFSPLADQGPDPSADVCWLPGGYPELHAGALAAAEGFRAGLQAFAETKPVHGECGGYMAMGEALVDKDGTRHRMAGLLGLVTSYANRKMHLGYRRALLAAKIPGQAAGAALSGHEFHYSTILDQPDAPLAQVTDATGAVVPETGSYRLQSGGGLSTGTYFHLIAGLR
ncbi:cobyrinate a,c-diamide synthase [Tabrizicola piscis]|uniref:Hydrogenobyrinate a,c-diamide synthase n=1 Tax=Tabrizicola piscis TaxID=2494374 RepID=A0A3S8U7U1_9RHOB|nr:cobyrinate a,c-diamide synthase [Tabrizicola piscis]AZL59637.1 cobyrinate a,c-diamide synthase [Tabrizicola piscis]